MSTVNYGRPCSAGDLAATYSGGTAVGLRWAATVIDMVVFMSVGGAVMAVFSHISPEIGVVLILVFITAYYVAMVGLLGRTVGKMALQIQVVDDCGNPPGIGKAVIRTLLRLVEISPIFCGGIPAAAIVYTSSQRQRLGDVLAHTYVLRVADAERLRAGTAVLSMPYPPLPSEMPPYVPGGMPGPGYPPPPGAGFPPPPSPFGQAPSVPAPPGSYAPLPPSAYPPPPPGSFAPPAPAPETPPSPPGTPPG